MKHAKTGAPVLAATVIGWLAPAAHAYVGPGLATGTVVLVLGVLGALLLWIVALVWYPCKRRWRRWRGSGQAAEEASGAESPAGDAAPPR